MKIGKMIKKQITYINIVLLLTSILCNSQTYNVKDFGAVGDGITLDSKSIQKAVDVCSNNGGGIIYFPSGKYLSGTIILKDDTFLELSPGATLLGSTKISDYKETIPQLKSFNDYFLKHALIYAEKVNNIGILGYGTIDGQGQHFKVTTKKKPDRYKNRPFVIRFVECKNVKVKNVKLQNSAMWMQQYLGCENVIINNITVYNHANKNNDMIDIDGCKNLIMSNCIGDTDDDGITIKSTSKYINENITINNCVVSSHCNALKFGTESTGGFRNVAISNIVIKPSSDRDPIYGVPDGISGITIGNVDGGIMEGIIIDNIRIDGPEVPLFMRLGNRARKHYDDAPDPGIGIFKDVMVSNILATNISSKVGCAIIGIPGNNIENVSLSNLIFEYPGGGTKTEADRLVPEQEAHYPEATRWGTFSAYGLYVRHARNINLDNIEFRLKEKDFRPAIVYDDVMVGTIDKIKTNPKSEKIIYSMKNSSDIMIDDGKFKIQIDDNSYNIMFEKNEK